MTWEGRKNHRDKPKAFTQVARGSMFIAEIPKPIPVCWLGKLPSVVLFLCLIWMGVGERQVCSSQLLMPTHSKSSGSPEDRTKQVALSPVLQMRMPRLRKEDQLAQGHRPCFCPVLPSEARLIYKTSVGRIRGQTCQPALFHSTRPREQFSGELLQLSLMYLKTQKPLTR